MKICSNILDVNLQQWEKLIAESPTATWFQTKEAYEFYASLPEIFSPFVVTGQREGGSLVGIAIGYITKERNAMRQFFTRRAIIVGGPLLAEDITNAELEALLHAVRQIKDKGEKTATLKDRFWHEPIYIEMRNFNNYSRWKEVFEKCGFAYQPHLNFHVDTSSLEVVKKNLGRGRRREVKIAQQNNVQIIEHPTIEQVHAYYIILQKLYRTKIHLPLFPWEFFEKLWELENAKYLLISSPESQIIGGTVCVALAGKCLYEWFACGEDEAFRTCYPSTMGTYAGIVYAAEYDLPRFDMMGAGKPEEDYGVRNFKAQFGGAMVEYGRFLHVNNRLLYRIGCWGVKLLKWL